MNRYFKLLFVSHYLSTVVGIVVHFHIVQDQPSLFDYLTHIKRPNLFIEFHLVKYQLSLLFD